MFANQLTAILGSIPGSGGGGPVPPHNSLTGVEVVSTTAVLGHIDTATYNNTFAASNYYVNEKATVTSPDGTFLKPYTTLSACMTAIGPPTTTADARRKIVVHIAAGEYDENVTVPKQRLITFMCYGTVIIGDGAADNLFNSTTPRNLTIENTATGEPVNAPSRPSFSVQVVGGQASSTHSAYNFGRLIISGDLQFNHVDGNTTTHETYLSSVKVQGNVTANAFELGSIHNFQCEKCFFDNTFNAANINMNVIRSTEFDGLITCASVGRFVECEIDGGITAVSVNNFYPPNGFVFCDVGGGTWNITDISKVPIDSLTLNEIINNSVTITNGYTVSSSPPSMTSTEIANIVLPEASMIVFNTTTSKHQGYDGTSWNDFY